MTIKKKKIVSNCVQNVQVKNYFVLSFKQKQVILFWKGEKVPIFCLKYFWIKRVIFFGQKNRNGWSHHVETFQEEKSGVIKRNIDNKIFVVAAVYCEFLYIK